MAKKKKTVKIEPAKKPKPKVKALFLNDTITTESSDAARDLNNQSTFGTILETGKVQLSFLEAMYLLEKGRIKMLDGRKKSINSETYLKKTKKLDPHFSIRYAVFKDMRDRGYVIKTALKFGAEFRVYDRGIKPGEDHARWIVYPVHESSALTWYEFSAKNRVAHSTKKRLLIGVVDEELDVTYYEIRWMRP